MWYIFDVGSLGGPASAVAAEPGVDNVEEVCARHPMGKPKIDNYTKLKAKLKDYGLKEAADALHADVRPALFLANLPMALSRLGGGSI